MDDVRRKGCGPVVVLVAEVSTWRDAITGIVAWQLITRCYDEAGLHPGVAAWSSVSPQQRLAWERFVGILKHCIEADAKRPGEERMQEMRQEIKRSIEESVAIAVAAKDRMIAAQQYEINELRVQIEKLKRQKTFRPFAKTTAVVHQGSVRTIRHVASISVDQIFAQASDPEAPARLAFKGQDRGVFECRLEHLDTETEEKRLVETNGRGLNFRDRSK